MIAYDIQKINLMPQTMNLFDDYVGVHNTASLQLLVSFITEL